MAQAKRANEHFPHASRAGDDARCSEKEHPNGIPPTSRHDDVKEGEEQLKQLAEQHTFAWESAARAIAQDTGWIRVKPRQRLTFEEKRQLGKDQEKRKALQVNLRGQQSRAQPVGESTVPDAVAPSRCNTSLAPDSEPAKTWTKEGAIGLVGPRGTYHPPSQYLVKLNAQVKAEAQEAGQEQGNDAQQIPLRITSWDQQRPARSRTFGKYPLHIQTTPLLPIAANQETSGFVESRNRPSQKLAQVAISPDTEKVSQIVRPQTRLSVPSHIAKPATSSKQSLFSVTEPVQNIAPLLPERDSTSAPGKQKQQIPYTPYSTMTAVKKYAGLPDVDEGIEIYETAVPDLTEASTLPTESGSESEDDNPDFDREALNPDIARQRFEPAVVDARHANFSDTIDGGRRDYQIRTRRRRRRAVRDGHQEQDDTDSDEETLQSRLARLRRETAELQAEIEGIEEGRDKESHTDGDSDYEDTVDRQKHHDDLSRGAEDLSKTLQEVSVASRTKQGRTLEEEFTQRLNQDSKPTKGDSKETIDTEALPRSSISAIAAFSDRLTALETTLGVSAATPATSTSSILPTIDTLSTQIEILFSIFTPDIRGTYPAGQPSSTAHLDPLAQKIRHLITESKRLEDARRTATKSFEELLENRDRHSHLIPHSHSSVHTHTEAHLSRALNSQDVNADQPATNGAPASMPTKSDMQNQFTSLFLDDQASRITALYNLLPTLQSLQPLLPLVLERLRALSVLHTGAAEVRGELDEVESALDQQEKDIKKWREAVESAEKAMAEGKVVMKENVRVVGGMVKGLEERTKALS